MKKWCQYKYKNKQAVVGSIHPELKSYIAASGQFKIFPKESMERLHLLEGDIR
jgi:hypothetical protein